MHEFEQKCAGKNCCVTGNLITSFLFKCKFFFHSVKLHFMNQNHMCKLFLINIVKVDVKVQLVFLDSALFSNKFSYFIAIPLRVVNLFDDIFMFLFSLKEFIYWFRCNICIFQILFRFVQHFQGYFLLWVLNTYMEINGISCVTVTLYAN